MPRLSDATETHNYKFEVFKGPTLTKTFREASYSDAVQFTKRQLRQWADCGLCDASDTTVLTHIPSRDPHP